MRREHVEYLACPHCKADLHILKCTSENRDGIKSGALWCSDCEAVFAIARYVPRFAPFENYANSFGFEWLKHARTQYDSYSGVPVSEKRFVEETGWPKKMEGQCILEIGCGSGRFTEQAASTAAIVVAMDYSYAVDSNFASNGRKQNVLIVQADLYSMPFRKAFFDRLFCFGVLQHTPDPKEAFLLMPDHLKPGGEIIIDIYRKYTGLLGLLWTKYWVRPITTRLRPEILYRRCKSYVEAMWPISKFVSRLPFGRQINRYLLLVADYRGVYALSERMLKEWAILDTFDMLSAKYDRPQTLETVKEWFRQADLKHVKVHYGYNGIVGSGRKG